MHMEKIENQLIMTPHELKTLEIDIEKKIFKINGEEFGKGCRFLEIICSPPEWEFKVLIDRPIEFSTIYNLKGKEKSRTLYKARYGKKIKR